MGRLAGWAPPQQVTVTLLCSDGTELRLWTTEAVFPPPRLPRDGARWFLACGPVGRPVPPVVRSFVAGLPDNAYAVLWTEINEVGVTVFAGVKHQLN